METTGFIVTSLFVLAYAMVSKRLQRSPITPPMVFVGVGVLAGSHGLGWLEIDFESELVLILLEITLALVLFTDAARIELRRLRSEFSWPARVLAIGMPLTIVLGTVFAVLLLDLPWEAALVLAVVLAPTDAALGQAVVSNRRVPVAVRQTINVESGLNDGIALPVLTVALALAGARDSGSPGEWVRIAAEQLGYGVVLGIAIGYLGGRLITKATRHSWMTHTFEELSAIAVALIAFGVTDAVGGSGFVAAFIGGMTMGNSSRSACDCLWDFAEAEGQLLTFVAFLIFGAGAVGGAFAGVDVPTIGYAILSLTVIRMVPVALALIRAHLRLETVAFIGWFGPRGLASILFGLLVLGDLEFAARGEVYDVVTITATLSVVLHGISAYPLSQSYAGYVDRCRDRRDDLMETTPAPEFPVRVPFGS